jgi:branched-chain amino acid transport system substrate-binding protein
VTLGCVLLLAACGGGSAPRRHHHRVLPVGPPRPKVLDVFSSLPNGSASGGNPMVAGIRLALAQAHGRAGGFVIRFVALSDSRPGLDGWNAAATAMNAEQVVTDPRATLYIGDVASGATEISAPILNEAGIPQITPGSPYVGLTAAVPNVTAAGEPRPKYDPTGVPTLLRIAPSDAVQAAADLLALKLDGCTRVAVGHDDTAAGETLSALIKLGQHLYGINVIADTALTPGRAGFAAYATTVRSLGANCLALAASRAGLAVAVTRAVHVMLPTIPIVGTSGICDRAWTNPADGGVLAVDDAQLQCTSPALPLSAYPGGAGFAAAYRAANHGATPAPAAILGYEAMKLGVDTISRLGGAADSRSALLRALFAIRHRNSVLGDYGFGPTGDTTLHLFGLFRVNPATGDPKYTRLLTPGRVL